MNPENFETLNGRDINFEVISISEENLNITPLPIQNLKLTPVLQKSCKSSTPLKSQTKSMPEQTCNNQPRASTPTPHKMTPTTQTTVSHLVPLKETFSSFNNPKHSNISKILIFSFGTSSNNDRFEKLRKSINENEKEGYIQLSYC